MHVHEWAWCAGAGCAGSSGVASSAAAPADMSSMASDAGMAWPAIGCIECMGHRCSCVGSLSTRANQLLTISAEARNRRVRRTNANLSVRPHSATGINYCLWPGWPPALTRKRGGRIVVPMRRSSRLRLFGLVFAPWFAVAAVDAPIVHVCPMHDGPMATQMAGMDHMASHAQRPASSDPAPTDHSHRPCTCLGCCCGASMAARPGLPVATPGLAFVRRGEPEPRARTVMVGRVEHALPFATAPPATLA
jgi:hypothetical protein